MASDRHQSDPQLGERADLLHDRVRTFVNERRKPNLFEVGGDESVLVAGGKGGIGAQLHQLPRLAPPTKPLVDAIESVSRLGEDAERKRARRFQSGIELGVFGERGLDQGAHGRDFPGSSVAGGSGGSAECETSEARLGENFGERRAISGLGIPEVQTVERSHRFSNPRTGVLVGGDRLWARAEVGVVERCLVIEMDEDQNAEGGARDETERRRREREAKEESNAALRRWVERADFARRRGRGVTHRGPFLGRVGG